MSEQALQRAEDPLPQAVVKAGFGVIGTGDQRLAVQLLCERWQLLPGVDVQLYQGKPWITIEGWVAIIRRNPQYAGIAARPLDAREKVAWGMDAQDVEVECTIQTRAWGPVTARGRVRAKEREMREGARGEAPLQSHTSEMAEKRAIARAAKLAFGPDVPTDEDVEAAAQVRVVELAQRQREVFGDEDGEIHVSAGAEVFDDEPAADTQEVIDTDTGEVLTVPA